MQQDRPECSGAGLNATRQGQLKWGRARCSGALLHAAREAQTEWAAPNALGAGQTLQAIQLSKGRNECSEAQLKWDRAECSRGRADPASRPQVPPALLDTLAKVSVILKLLWGVVTLQQHACTASLML